MYALVIEEALSVEMYANVCTACPGAFLNKRIAFRKKNGITQPVMTCSPITINFCLGPYS